MTKYLTQLRLQDNTTTEMLEMLEYLSGRHGIDISFSAELQAQLRRCIESLGLDPKDTSLAEFYKALETKVSSDGIQFIDEIAKGVVTEEEFASKLASHLNKVFTHKTILVPKKSVLKAILKKNPPKAAAKMLHYRSIDSLLRRCPMPILLAACEAAEPKKWRKAFLQKIDKLQTNDFELQRIEFCAASSAKWKDIHGRLLSRAGHSIYRVNVAGGIVIVPNNAKIEPATAILFLMASLSALSKIRAHGSFTPRVLLDSSVPTGFAEHVYDLDSGTVIIRQIQFGWREIHHHMVDDPELRGLFEPHISKKTVEGDDIASLLRTSAKSLSWWAENLSVAMSDGEKMVSANLYDISRNKAFSRTYENGTTMAFSRELDLRLRLRYLASENLRAEAYNRLNAATDFEPDALMLELEEDL